MSDIISILLHFLLPIA